MSSRYETGPIESPGMFRYTLFDVCDTEHNLDYVDSNGDRYEQILSRVQFTSDRLTSSTLTYCPDSRSDLYSDTLVSTIHVPIKNTATQNHLSPQVAIHALRDFLVPELGDFRYELDEDHCTIIADNDAKMPPLRFYISDSDFAGYISVQFELDCNPKLPQERRYADIRYGAHIHAMLHDFAYHLPVLTNSSIERAAFAIPEHEKTLEIGIERSADLSRFGMALLTALVELENLQSSRPAPKITADINYKDYEKRTKALSDLDLRKFARYIVLASSTSSEIRNETINEAARALLLEIECCTS